MHSSISINLNLLSLIETHYDSLERLKVFSVHAFIHMQIQESTNNPGLKKIILQIQIQNMVGRSYFQKDFIRLLIKISA